MRIKRIRTFAPLYSMAEGDGGGGGGGGTEPLTMTAEELATKISEGSAAAVTAAVADARQGLDAKNQELLAKLRTNKDALDKWGDLDATSVRGMLDQFESNEEMKLLAEGKTDEVITRRMEKVTLKHDTDMDAITTENTANKTALEAANITIRDLLIDSRVVTAFNGEKGLEGAAPDVVSRAKSVFKVEDGEVVARDGKGELIRGADGVLTITEWIGNLKTEAPHLFPGSGGGGAGGGGTGGGGGGSEQAMVDAATRGDMKEFRKLRDIKDKARLAANER